MAEPTPEIDPRGLAPFISFLVIEYVGSDLLRAVSVVSEFLRNKASRARGGADRVIVASGLMTLDEDGASDDGPDEVDAFVYRHNRPPSWLKSVDGVFSNESHELSVIIRRDKYIAIGGADFRDAMERWLRGRSAPPFRLVQEWILEQALLAGEAKGLWLRGTHHRTPAKADTKNVTGVDLHRALSAIEDGSYALRSGRAALADSPTRAALVGTVGTTPSDSIVWSGRADGWAQYVDAACELIDLIGETDVAGRSEPVLSQLTVPVSDLHGVSGAYEVLVPARDEVIGLPGASDELIHAAEVLEASILGVVGSPTTPHFDVILGRNGSEVGRARATVSAHNGRVEVRFGAAVTPSDPTVFSELRDALDCVSDVSAYYESGHVIRGSSAYRYTFQPAPFRGWEFADFSSTDVSLEKPAGAIDEGAIHSRCGAAGDDSLFGWVVRRFDEGWLVCDDGAGEVADFIHIANDGALSLIHVKGAYTTSALRMIAVGPYEVVVSQATKNVTFLGQEMLAAHMEPTRNTSRAAWVDGRRVPGRTAFLDALALRSPRDASRLVIVQPHVLASRYDAAVAAPSSVDGRRLALLDNLLNTASASAASGAGASLTVIGCA